MKRCLWLLLALLLLPAAAMADQAEEIARAVHPDCVVEQRLDAGGTTLLVLGHEDRHVLFMLEGSLILTDNDAALLPGELPGWSFTEDALAWDYPTEEGSVRYSARREAGVWGPVSMTVSTQDRTRTIRWENGLLYQADAAADGETRLTPIPMPQWTGQIILPNFDAAMLPQDVAELPAESW